MRLPFVLVVVVVAAVVVVGGGGAVVVVVIFVALIVVVVVVAVAVTVQNILVTNCLGQSWVRYFFTGNIFGGIILLS